MNPKKMSENELLNAINIINAYKINSPNVMQCK